ncbi:MAG TPA: DUF4212 domain-containing protein [Planctomycetota bacterium]|jgi:putative solute:sodium symporter small subunit|nr:DUF4212 domain-containing protein [Planctomycetota bacterium]
MNDTPPLPPHEQPAPSTEGLSPARRTEYWRRNLRLVCGLLLIWAGVSFGCGVLLHRWLDHWQLPGTAFPLGFWFAQQGAMLVFIGLVFYYAHRMNRLDREYGVEED